MSDPVVIASYARAPMGGFQGVFAEDAVRDYQFTREQQDQYALRSLSCAQAAISGGGFEREIAPVSVAGRGGETDVDEQRGEAKPDKIPGLKPAFAKDRTSTAANTSPISYGAAALVMARASVAEKLGLKVVEKVVAHAARAH
jgi:acetyl-CoA C-acetyltransferase